MNKQLCFGNGKTYVVAEMACAHDGHLDRARSIINAAAQSKADAVQFQIFTVSNLISPLSPSFEQSMKLEIPSGAWPMLFDHVRSLNLDIWATIFDEASLSIACECGADVIKIHSSDLSNPGLLKQAAFVGRPLALSVGGSLPEEIDRAVNFLRKNGACEILLIHGFQAFPTKPYDSHLRFIQTLKSTYGCPVGYQDHTDGGSPLATALPLAAIGFGAVVLEKHLTDDRSRKGIDYESSLGPDEFAHFVELVRTIDEAAGDGSVRPLSVAELEYRRRMKKSAVLASSVKKGDLITKEKLRFMRSGTGISPWDAQTIIGGVAVHDMEAYTSLLTGDVSLQSLRKEG